MNDQQRAAMQMAKNALEMQIHGAGSIIHSKMAWDALTKALAQPQDHSGEATDMVQGEWAIDTSTGTDILVYKNCSVIEGEQAHYVFGLIKAEPQSEWVDLTDDDVVEFEDKYLVNYRIPLGGQYDFARAVIKKAKEKNGII